MPYINTLSFNPYNRHILTCNLWIHIIAIYRQVIYELQFMWTFLCLKTAVWLWGSHLTSLIFSFSHWKKTIKTDVILTSIIRPSWKLRDSRLNGSRSYKNESLHWCEQWITQKIISHWIVLKQSISAHKLETHEKGRQDPVFHLRTDQQVSEKGLSIP